MILLLVAHIGSATLYVSTRGTDAGDGSKAHPMARIEQAIDRLRELPHSSATVRVEPGTYRVEKPITLGSKDLASPLSIVSSDARKGATIDGGREVTGWTVGANGWWTVTIPDVAAGKWYFSELFVNGARRLRPRLPRQGYFYIASEVPPSDSAKGHGSDRFGFIGSDIDPNWANRDDIELVLFHNWSITEGRIGQIEGNTVTLKSPTCSSDSWAGLPKGNRFLVDNVKDALGTPGDWYLDRNTGVLTYVPIKGETPGRTQVVAPIAPSLIEVRGDAASQKWASNLRLSGLTLQHTLWNIPVLGRSFPQAEADLRGAVNLEAARDVTIDHCTIKQVGEYAVEIGQSCQRVQVAHTSICDIGAGGIKIGRTERVTDEELLTSDCRVEDSTVLGFGRRAPAAIGIWIGQSPRNTILHNTIEDGYYTGVSVGWSWGYAPSASHHNLIEGNRIGQIGQDVLSDMGGIYTLGVAPGTVLRSNFIHDVSSFSYGGWGIYPDEGSSGLLIKNNVATRCKSAGFHQHYGQDNLVVNNIWAFNREAQLMRTRAEDHRSFTFDRNIVIWNSGLLLASNWTGTGFAMDHNLYWDTSGKPLNFMGQSLSGWRSRGLDVNSQIADPLFADALHDDFRLDPKSPALKLGFKPFDFRAIGAADQPAARASLPRAWPE